MKTLPIVIPLLVASAFAQDHIRVGSWNLEHFGARKNRRVGSDYSAIADFIRKMEVDVLGVQEIRTQAALELLVSSLGENWSFVLGTSGGFSDGTGGIRVGFLWNKQRIDLVQAEELLQLPSEENGLNIFHRKPVSAVFRAKGGGVDFRAITVHFKASRGAKNEAKRKAEARNLRKYIEQLQKRPGEDQDIVVVGDFNHTFGAPAYEVFTESDFVHYLRAPGNPRTIVHFTDPIDQCAITKGIESDLAAKRLRVHGKLAERDLDGWRRVYSDHIPVTFDLSAKKDRDPDATFAPAGPNQWLRPGGKAAATSAPRRTTAAAATTSRKPSLTPGTPVRVFLNNHQSSTMYRDGILRSTLGSWVHIEGPNGDRMAFPSTSILSVQERRTR